MWQHRTTIHWRWTTTTASQGTSKTTRCRAQWLRGRASDSRLRKPGFESCAAVLKPWASFFTLHCSSSLSCINKYLAIDSGGYVYEQLMRIHCSIWLDASQRSQDGVWVNRSVRVVKRFERSWGLDTALYKNLPFLKQLINAVNNDSFHFLHS